MNLNYKQVLTILAAILSVTAASAVQLTDIVGPGPTKVITGIAGYLAGIVNIVLSIYTGQAQTVKDTLAMPGVHSVEVNEQANPVLARVALDPEQPKIAPTPQAQAAVEQTAKEA